MKIQIKCLERIPLQVGATGRQVGGFKDCWPAGGGDVVAIGGGPRRLWGSFWELGGNGRRRWPQTVVGCCYLSRLGAVAARPGDWGQLLLPSAIGGGAIERDGRS